MGSSTCAGSAVLTGSSIFSSTFSASLVSLTGATAGVSGLASRGACVSSTDSALPSPYSTLSSVSWPGWLRKKKALVRCSGHATTITIFFFRHNLHNSLCGVDDLVNRALVGTLALLLSTFLGHDVRESREVGCSVCVGLEERQDDDRMRSAARTSGGNWVVI